MGRVSLAASKIGSGGLWNLDYRCGKRVGRPYTSGHAREEYYSTVFVTRGIEILFRALRMTLKSSIAGVSPCVGNEASFNFTISGGKQLRITHIALPCVINWELLIVSHSFAVAAGWRGKSLTSSPLVARLWAP